jgi:hypothetical protein
MTGQAEKPNLLKEIPLAVVWVGGVVTLVGLSGKLPDRITPPTAPSIPQECRMACPARATLGLSMFVMAQAGAYMYNETIALERPTPEGWWKPGFRRPYHYNTPSRNAISLGAIVVGCGVLGDRLLARSFGQSKSSNKGREPENPPNFLDRGSR